MESDISFSLDPVPGGASAISSLQQTTGTLATQGTGISDSATGAAVASQTVCSGSASSLGSESDIPLTLDPGPAAAVSSQPPKSSTTTCTAQTKDDASGSTIVGPSTKTTQVVLTSDAKTYASASSLSRDQKSNSKRADTPTSTNISVAMTSIPSKSSTSTCAVQNTTGNNESTGKVIATLPRSRHKSDGIHPGWTFDDTEDSVAVLEPVLYNKVSLCRKRFQEYLDKLKRDAANQSRTDKLQYITSQERKKGSFAIFRYNYLYQRKDRAILNRPISGYVENSYSNGNSSIGISHDAGAEATAITDIIHQRNLCPQQYEGARKSTDARIMHERPSRTRYTQNCPSLPCSPTIGIPEGHCQSRYSASADRASTSTGINRERSLPPRRSYDDGGIRASTSTAISHERDVVDRRFYDAHGQVRTCTGITHGPNLYPQQYGNVRSNANAVNVHEPSTETGYIHSYPNAFYSSNTWGPDWFYQSSYPGQANTRTGISHESNPYSQQHEGIPRAPDARIMHETPTRIGDIQNYANPFYSSNCWVPDWVLQSDYAASVDQANHRTGISHDRSVPTRRSYDGGVRANVSTSHESSVARRFYNADLQAGTNTDSSNERNAAAHRFTPATTRATGSAGEKSGIIVIDDDDDDDDVMIVDNEDPSSIWRGHGTVEIVDSSEEEGEAEEAEEEGKQPENNEATAEEDNEEEKEAETVPKQEEQEKEEEQEVVEVTMYEYEEHCGLWSIEPTRDSVEDFEWQEIDNEIFYDEFELMVRTHLSERLLWYDESMNIAPNLRDRMFGRCIDANTHLQRFFEKLLNFIVGRRGLNTIEWRYFFKRCFDWLKIIKICYKFPLIYNKVLAYWFAKFLEQYAVHIVLCSDDNFIIENAVISQMHSLLDGDVRAVGLTLLHMEMFRDLTIPLYRSIVNEFFLCHVSEWDVELYVIVLLCIMKWASFQRPSRIMKDISCPEFLNLPSHVPPSSQTDAEYGPVFGVPSLRMHRTRNFLVQQLYIPEAIQKFFQIYLESLGQRSSEEQSMEERRRDRDRNHEQMNPDSCRDGKELDQPRKSGQNFKSSKSLSTHLTNECDTQRAKISTSSCNSKQMNSVAFKKNSDINLCKKSNGENSVDIIEIDLLHDEIENSQAYKPKSDSSESPSAHKPGNLKKFSLCSKNINNGSSSASHNISVISNTISIVTKNSNKTLESLYRGKKAATSSSDCYLESLYEMLDTHAPSKKRKNKTPQSVPRARYSNSLNSKEQNLNCSTKTLSSLYGNKLNSDVQRSICLDSIGVGEKQISNSLRRSCESDSKTCNSDNKKTDILPVFNEVSEPLAHSNTPKPHARDKPNSSGMLDVLHRGRKGSNDIENSISQSNNTTLRHLYGREFLSNIRQSRTQNSQKRSYREICTVVLESSSDEESSVEKPSLSPDKLANVSTVPSTMSAKTITNSDCLKKVLSIPEQCRSIMESIATKPTRKEKHCIQGEVSSTTSHDNVVASNGHITSSPDFESLEVHSTDDYQNARVVGTVNLVEQPNSSFQSINVTLEPGRVLLGIDYSDDDDEGNANDDTNDGDFLTGGYWKVIEEATSSTEITHRTQSSEVIVLSALVNSAARPSTGDFVMREKISFPENISSCSNFLGNAKSAHSNASTRLTTKKTTNDKSAVVESPSAPVQSKSTCDTDCSTSRKIRSQLNSESVGKDESRKRIGASVLGELSENAIVSQQGVRTNANANQSTTAQGECATVAQFIKPVTMIAGISEKNSKSALNAAVNRTDEHEQHPEEAEIGIFKRGVEANSAVDAESHEAADVEKMLADIDENLRKASEIDIKYRKELKPDNVDLGSASLPKEFPNAIEKSVIAESSAAACETLIVHVGGELSNALEADNYASKLADDSSKCKIDESVVEILDDRVAVVKQTTIKSVFSEKEPEPTGNCSHSAADHENENTSNALECVRSISITEAATCSSLSAQGRKKEECSSVEEFNLKSVISPNQHLEVGVGKSNINDSVTCPTKSKVIIINVDNLPDNCEENKPTDVEESSGVTTETFKKEESLKTSKIVALDNVVNVVDVSNVRKIKSMSNRKTTPESHIGSEKIKEKTWQNNCPAGKGNNNVNIVERIESVKGEENLSLKSETNARSCDVQKCQHKSDVNPQIDAASEITPDHRGKDEQLKSINPDTGNTDCKQQISASDSKEIIIDSRDTLLLHSVIPKITQNKEIRDKDFSELEIDLNGIKSKSRSEEITDSVASERKNVESESLMNAIENQVQPVANLKSPTSVSNSTCSNHSETNKIQKSVEDIALNSDNTNRQSNITEPDFSKISIDITQEEDKEILAKHCKRVDTENNGDLLSENIIHENSTGNNSQEIKDNESLVADHKKVKEGEDLLTGYKDTVHPLVNRKLISSIATTLSSENDKFVEDISLNSDKTRTDSNRICSDSNVCAITDTEISNIRQDKDTSAKQCSRENVDNNRDLLPENDLHENSVPKGECKIGLEKIEASGAKSPDHKKVGEENECLLKGIENTVQSQSNYEFPTSLSSTLSKDSQIDKNDELVENTTLNSENTDYQCLVSQSESCEFSKDPRECVLPATPNITQGKKLSAEHCSKKDLSSSSDPNITQDKKLSAAHDSKKNLVLDSNSVQLSENVLCENGLGKSESKISLEEIAKSETLTPGHRNFEEGNEKNDIENTVQPLPHWESLASISNSTLLIQSKKDKIEEFVEDITLTSDITGLTSNVISKDSRVMPEKLLLQSNIPDIRQDKQISTDLCSRKDVINGGDLSPENNIKGNGPEENICEELEDEVILDSHRKPFGEDNESLLNEIENTVQRLADLQFPASNRNSTSSNQSQTHKNVQHSSDDILNTGTDVTQHCSKLNLNRTSTDSSAEITSILHDKKVQNENCHLKNSDEIARRSGSKKIEAEELSAPADDKIIIDANVKLVNEETDSRDYRDSLQSDMPNIVNEPEILATLRSKGNVDSNYNRLSENDIHGKGVATEECKIIQERIGIDRTLDAENKKVGKDNESSLNETRSATQQLDDLGSSVSVCHSTSSNSPQTAESLQIVDVHTLNTESTDSKQNEPVSGSNSPQRDEIMQIEDVPSLHTENTNTKQNEPVSVSNSTSSNFFETDEAVKFVDAPSLNTESTDSKPNELVSVSNSKASIYFKTNEGLNIVDVPTLNTESTDMKHNEPLSVNNSTSSNFSEADEAEKIVDVPTLNTESTDMKHNEPLTVSNSTSSNFSEADEAVKILDVPTLNTESTDNKPNTSQSDSNAISIHSIGTSQSDVVTISVDRKIFSTSTEESEIAAAADKKFEKYDKCPSNGTDNIKERLSDWLPSVNTVSSTFTKSAIIDKNVKSVQDTTFNVESTDPDNHHISQSNSDEISTASAVHAEPDALLLQSDIPLVKRKLPKSSSTKTGVAGRAGVRKKSILDKSQCTRKPQSSLASSGMDSTPTSNNAELGINEVLVDREHLLLTVDNRDSNVVQKDGPLNIRNQNKRGKSIHFERKRIREDESVSRKMLSMEDVEKRTPWKMRIKRRISQCSDINKEFNIESYDEVKNERHERIIRNENADKTVHELAFDIAKLDISKSEEGLGSKAIKSDIVSGSWFQKSQPSCSANNSDTPNAGKDNLSRSLQAGNMSNVHSTASCESNCVDLSQEQNMLSEQNNNDANERHSLDHMPSNYNPEEILVVTTLINMRNNYDNTSQKPADGLADSIAEVKDTGGQVVSKPEELACNAIVPTAIVKPVGLKSILKKGKRTNSIKKNVRYDLAPTVINCADATESRQNTAKQLTTSSSKANMEMGMENTNCDDREAYHDPSICVRKIDIGGTKIKVKIKTPGRKRGPKPKQQREAHVTSCIMKPKMKKVVVRIKRLKMETIISATSKITDSAANNPCDVAQKSVLKAVSANLTYDPKEAVATKEPVPKSDDLDSEDITHSITEGVKVDLKLSTENNCAQSSPSMESARNHLTKIPANRNKHHKCAEVQKTAQLCVRKHEIPADCDKHQKSDEEQKTAELCAQGSPSVESVRKHKIPADCDKHQKGDGNQKTAQLCARSSPSVESVRKRKIPADCDKHQKGDENQKTAQLCARSSPSVESVRKHKIPADCDKHQKGDENQKTAQLCARSSPSVESVRKRKIPADCDKHQKGDENQKTIRDCAQSSASMDSVRNLEIPADCDKHQKGDEEQKTAELCAQGSPSVESVRKQKIPADCDKHQKGDEVKKTAELCAQSSPSMESVRKHKIPADCDKHQKGDENQKTAQPCARSSPSVESVRKRKIPADCDKHQKGDEEQKTAELCAQGSPSVESVRKQKIPADCDKHQKGDEVKKTAELCAQSSPSVESVRKHKIPADCDKHQKGDENQKTAQLCARSSPSVESVRKRKIPADCDKHQKGDEEQKTAELCAQGSPSVESVRKQKIPADCDKHQKGDEVKKTAELCAQSSPSVESVRKHKIPADCDKHQKGDENQKTAQLCARSSPSVESVRKRKIPADCDKHQKGDENQKTVRDCAQSSSSMDSVRNLEIPADFDKHQKGDEEQKTAELCAQGSPSVESVSKHKIPADCDKHQKGDEVQKTPQFCAQSSPSMDSVRNLEIPADCDKHQKGDEVKKTAELCAQSSPNVESVRKHKIPADCDKHQKGDENQKTAQLCARSSPSVESVRKRKIPADCDKHQKGDEEQKTAELCAQGSPSVESVRKQKIPADCDKHQKGDEVKKTAELCAQSSPSVESVRKNKIPADCGKHQKGDEAQKTPQLYAQSSPSVESVRKHEMLADCDKHQKSDEAQKTAQLLEVAIKAEPADDGNAFAVSVATSVPTGSANIKEEIENTTYCESFVDSSQYYYDANLVRHSKDIILRPTDVILTEEIVNEQAKAQCYKESQRAKVRQRQLGKSENLKNVHIKLSKVKQGDAMASGVRTKERDDSTITKQTVDTKLAKVAQKPILKAATANLTDDPKETLAAEEPVPKSEDVDSEDITHSITQGVLADLKLLSSENHCAQSFPSVESVRHHEKPANCDKHQKCDEEQKTAQLLDSSIEIVLGNSCFAKADASGLKPQLAGAVAANADSSFNSPANEGMKRTSTLKGRLDILTAEKINSSIEKILEHKPNFCKDIDSGPCVEASLCSQTGIHSKQEGSTGRNEPFRMCSKNDEDISKKVAKKSLNDVKVISANVPEALFADDESENSNSEEVKDDEKFFAPILCLEPINELPNKSCSDFKEKDLTERVHESGDRNTLATPNLTIETEVKLTTQRCGKPAGCLSMEGKTNETRKDNVGPKSDADELNANLEVTEVAFSLPAIAEISAIDIPNDLSITNDYPDLLDAMLFEQVRQSMDCMISGTNSAKKWSQDCFTSSNGPNMGQTEVSGRAENNTDISGGAAEKGTVASETKEITLNEDALGIGQDSFLGTISPLDEVEVSTTTGFDLVGSFTMEDFLADGSGDFFSFPELDKTQSRSNSFSNDSVICTPPPPDAVADIDDDEHMEIVQSVACDHSYNKYFMTVEEPERRKVPLAKSLPINSTPLPQRLPHGKSMSSSPNKSPAESPFPMFSKSKCHPKPFWKVKKNDGMETSTPKKNDEKTFDDSQTSAFSTYSSSGKEKRSSSSNDGVEGNQFLNMPVLETNSSLAGANVSVKVAASDVLSTPTDIESSNNVKPTTEDNIDDKMTEVHTQVKETEEILTTIPHISAPVNDISKGPWPEENLCKKEDPLPVEKCAKKAPIEITEVITIAPPIITQPIIRIQSQTNRLERIDPQPTIAQPNHLNSTSEPENELIEIQRACEANVTFMDSARDSSTPTLDERTKDDEEEFDPETTNTSVPIESEDLKECLQKICPKRPLKPLADAPPPKKHCSDAEVKTLSTNEIFNMLKQEESLQKQLVTTGANVATNLTETVTSSPQRKTAVAEIATIDHTTATNLSEQIQPQMSPKITLQSPLQIPPQILSQIPPSIDKVKCAETLENTKREVKSAEVKRTSSNTSPSSSSDAVSFVTNSTNIDQSSQIVQSSSNVAVLQSSPAQNGKAKRSIEAAAEPNVNENVKRRNSCEVSAQKNQNGTSHNTFIKKAFIKKESMRRNSSNIQVRTVSATGSEPLCLGENPKPCQSAMRQSVPSSAESVREVDISRSVTSSRAEALAQHTSKTALKHPLGGIPRALGHISEKPSPHAKPVFGVLETPIAKIESSTPSPNYSSISPSVRHNLARTSPASSLSAKNRVHPYQQFTSTPTSYKSKYIYQRNAVPSLADSVHTNVSSQRSEAGKTLKNAQPANAANPSYSAGLNISAIKLSSSDEAMILSKLESYRGTLPQAQTYKEHRENQRLIKLQEEKLKLEFLEKEKRRQAQHLLAEAQRLKRKSHAESYESHYKKFAFANRTLSNSQYTSQHLQPQQQHQRHKQRQKYVNKFSEIEKQVVGSKKFSETKTAHRGDVEALASAPLTTSTAWEPKSASVDEIIEHLTKLRKT